jgi:hypothetical protein
MCVKHIFYSQYRVTTIFEDDAMTVFNINCVTGLLTEDFSSKWTDGSLSDAKTMRSQLVITHDGRPKMLLRDNCKLSELLIDRLGKLICAGVLVTLEYARNGILSTYLIQTDKYEIITYYYDNTCVIIPNCYLTDPSVFNARQIKSVRSI